MTRLLSLICLLSILLSSCKKPAGSGGQATLKGKVIVKNYDGTFTVLKSTAAATDQDVYIIYGDDDTYGDKTKTGPDGVYEFKYLRKGTYKIYVYSKIPANPKPSPSTQAIYQSGTISHRKGTIELPDITIIN